jgi:hypothetical protein
LHRPAVLARVLEAMTSAPFFRKTTFEKPGRGLPGGLRCSMDPGCCRHLAVGNPFFYCPEEIQVKCLALMRNIFARLVETFGFGFAAIVPVVERLPIDL